MQRIHLGLDVPQLLTEPSEVERACAELKSAGVVAVDTEGTGLDIVRDYPLYVGVSNGEQSIAVPVRSEGFAALESLLGDEKITFVFHNAKYDCHMLKAAGMDVKGQWHDTLVMSTMTDSSRSSKRLKDLLVSLYGINDPRSIRYQDFSGTFGKVTKKKGQSAEDRLASAPIDVIARYVTCDAWGTHHIYQTFKSLLEHIHNWRGQPLWDLFYNIEVPFTKVLWDMERRGTKVDTAYLSELGKDWTTQMEAIEREFAQKVGRAINIRSGPQLAQYFIGERKLTTRRKTLGGDSGEAKSSLDKITLGDWVAKGVEEAALVLKYRSLSVLVKTFVTNLVNLPDAQGRIHTTYNQMVDTGRLSSDSPNLQNIPVRSEDGKKIRAAFIAEVAWLLLVRDYDQLEMKLAAALSGDATMIGIINAGKDIHSGNASLAFKVPYDDIISAVEAKEVLKDRTKKGLSTEPLTAHQKECLVYRDNAKTIGFGTLYGEGDWKLSTQLKCSLEEARVTKAQFFAPFPTLLKFIESTHREVERNGCVQTLTGRFRSLPAGKLLNLPAHSEALRQSFNSKVQGSAADVAKLAMIRCHNDPRLRGLEAHLQLQVHDELIFEHPETVGDEVNKIVGEHMEHCLEDVGLVLPLRLTSSGRSAHSWAAAK